MTNYTREQLRTLYLKLPPEIKEMASSDEATAVILKTCEDNQIVNERVTQISALTRNVLFGLLPPKEFQTTVEKEMGLDAAVAKKISQEINRFIFFPVKESLASLYKIVTEGSAPKEEASGAAVAVSEKRGAPKTDAYRELVE